MSILGVRVPAQWPANTFLKVFRKVAKVNFTFLLFKKIDGNKGLKTAFVQLSEKADPQMVIELLSQQSLKDTGRLKAFIVDEIPEADDDEEDPIDVHDIKPLKKTDRKENMGKKLVIPTLKSAHYELLSELQSKYNQLNKFSEENTEHKLMNELTKKVFKRIVAVAKESPAQASLPFQLTSAYRRAHPHTTDVQFILSTLHQLEDAEGKPRTELSESDLMQTPDITLCVDSIPYDKILAACNKYTEKISKTVVEHIDNLKTETTDEVDPDKLRVRRTLKKISPYMPMMIRQVMSKHLVPQDLAFRKVRIYGEPFLPGQEVMRTVLRPYYPTAVKRVQAMYNLLLFTVPSSKYAAVLKLDKTSAGQGTNCKLVVRSSDERRYVTPDNVMKELIASLRE